MIELQHGQMRSRSSSEYWLHVARHLHVSLDIATTSVRLSHVNEDWKLRRCYALFNSVSISQYG